LLRWGFIGGRGGFWLVARWAGFRLSGSWTRGSLALRRGTFSGRAYCGQPRAKESWVAGGGRVRLGGGRVTRAWGVVGEVGQTGRGAQESAGASATCSPWAWSRSVTPVPVCVDASGDLLDRLGRGQGGQISRGEADGTSLPRGERRRQACKAPGESGGGLGQVSNPTHVSPRWDGFDTPCDADQYRPQSRSGSASTRVDPITRFPQASEVLTCGNGEGANCVSVGRRELYRSK
jgi:hypothetical protein